MKLPQLQTIASKEIALETFYGINDNIYIPEGCFKDMKNLTSDYYPAIGQRKIREEYLLTGNINGAIELNNKLYIVSGTKMYKDGIEIKNLSLTDTQKQLYNYGAYIIIMPDKIMYNTEDGKSKKMSYQRKIAKKTSGDSLPYLYLSDKDGNPYAVMPATVNNAPTSKTQGDKTIKEFQNSITDSVPKYINTSDIKVLWGTPSILKAYTGEAGSESLGLISTNSAQELSIKYWNENNASWNTPTLYVTWWWRTTTEIAKEIEETISSEDFISLKVTNDNGADMKESAYPDYTYRIWKYFNSYAKVEKILSKDGDIGIVFSNAGIDFLTYFQKTYKSGIKKGVLVTNADTTKDKDPGIISITPFILRMDFPWDGNFSNLTIKKDMPDMDYITVSENRLWGCSNKKHEIYACKQGDPTNWHAYAGLANDSYTVTIGSPGDFTGACTYKGMPYFFKDNLIICMYGSRPANYQVSEIYYPGVESGSSQSFYFLNGMMYFKSRQGIVRFDGSSTQLISEELGKKVFKNAVACAGDKKYYVAMTENEENRLFVYDSQKSMWHKEDELRPDFLFKYGASVYAVKRNDSIIYRLDGLENISDKLPNATKSEEIKKYEIVENIKIYNKGLSWYAETGKIESGTIKSKYIQRLGIRYELDRLAVLKVKIKYDNDDNWMELYVHEGKKGEGAVSIAFRPRRCEKFRLRFEGEGKCIIYNIQRIVNEGSDMHNGNF